MNNYTILRIQKLNDIASIRRSLKHAFREQDTPNADPSLLSENTHFFADDVATAMQKIKMRWPEKIRKNGVRLVEFLVTASPDAINTKTRQEQDAYFADALKYIQDKHGAENVAYAGIHRDETTPHMYVYVVPLDERGKLNCNGFYGKRTSLSDLQTDFTSRVGEPHGFVRGEMRSKAKHTSIKQYYTRVNAVENMTLDSDEITYPEPKLIDKAKTAEYGQKVADAVTEQLTKQFQDQLKKSKIEFQNTIYKNDSSVAASARAKELEIQKSKALSDKVIDINEELRNLNNELSDRNEELSQKLNEELNNVIKTQKELDMSRKRYDALYQITSLFTEKEYEMAKLRDENAKKAAKEAQEARERQEAAEQARLHEEHEQAAAAIHRAELEQKLQEAKAREQAQERQEAEQKAAEQARLREEREQAAAATRRAELEAKWAEEARLQSEAEAAIHAKYLAKLEEIQKNREIANAEKLRLAQEAKEEAERNENRDTDSSPSPW